MDRLERFLVPIKKVARNDIASTCPMPCIVLDKGFARVSELCFEFLFCQFACCNHLGAKFEAQMSRAKFILPSEEQRVRGKKQNV